MFASIATKVALQRAGLGNLKLPEWPKNDTNSKGGEQGGQKEPFEFSNPFKDVQWNKPFASWQSPTPPPVTVNEAPLVGSRAPSNLKLKFPAIDGRPVVLVFLRFCGCPFTQKIFLHLRSLANRHRGIHFIAVSHCTTAATTAWVKKLGGAWNVDVIVDQQRELYAQWGLGLSNWGHLLHPRNGYNQVLLAKNEGVWGEKVGDGGCRWQTGGVYAVDERGVVRWGAPMKSVDEHVVLEDGIRALGS